MISAIASLAVLIILPVILGWAILALAKPKIFFLSLKDWGLPSA